MSTKMELTKEVEKLLNKARTLKLRNEAYFQQSKSQTSSSSSASNLCSGGTSQCDDVEDVVDDIIDVNALNLSDDETWLCSAGNSSDCEDILEWVRNDVNEAKDAKYQGRQILLQFERTRLSNKVDNNIDSRTFTRPKKKMTRPSLESINSTFKYSAFKNLSIDNFSCNNSPNTFYKECSDIRLSLLKNSDTFRKKSSNESISVQDFYKNPKDDFITKIQKISNKIKDVESKSNSFKLSKNSDLSTSLENIIRDQMQKLEAKKPNFLVDESVQNAPSPPPGLMSNSGFGSANFTSLTESDFITAECQPQDLFTSYTSTVAADLAEDQRDVIQGLDETYSKDIHNLCETISKDINSKINDTLVLDASHELDATHVIEEDSIDNITYIEAPKYAEKHSENLASGDSKKESYDKLDINILNISNNSSPRHIPEHQSTKILSETNVLSYSESEKEFIETDTEKSYCDGSGDNTFTKLSSSNKISLSDPNLREQKNMHDNILNHSFEKTKIQNHRNESSDSLDLNSSFSSINSSRIATYHDDFDNKAAPIASNKFLLERSLKSTPKAHSKLVKQSWASIETLSPILHSSPKREQRYVKSAQNIASSTFTRNTLSDTKVLSSAETEDAHRTFRRIDKAHDVYRTTDDVSSLKEQIPTMIVKPMEVKRLAAPSTSSAADLKVNSTITVSTQNKQSMLRQPAVRSGLPRPTSTTSIGSGIPRPQSRLPVPRSLKPPSSSIAKPVIPTKNNWMDGCY